MTFGQTTKRAAASLVIAVGFVLVFLGINASVTGKAAQKLPAEIESISPLRSATQVPSQDRIMVDFVEGYTGVLIVNSVELETFDLADAAVPQPKPGQQVSLPPVTIFEPGNYTLSFTPTNGAKIEEFATGVNTVEVRYWKLVDGPGRAKSFRWQFDVV